MIRIVLSLFCVSFVSLLPLGLARAESIPIELGFYAKNHRYCSFDDTFEADHEILNFLGDGLNGGSTHRRIQRQRADGNTYILDLEITREDNGGRNPEKRTWVVVIDDNQHMIINGGDGSGDWSGTYQLCHSLDPEGAQKLVKEAHLAPSFALRRPSVSAATSVPSERPLPRRIIRQR